MILPVHQRVREQLLATLRTLYQLPADALPSLALEYPPTRELGDLATPAAFELARRLRKPPRAIAQEIAAALGAVEGISRVEAAPNGYLNIYLDRAEFFRVQIEGKRGRVPFSDELPEKGTRPLFPAGKTIIEHT